MWTSSEILNFTENTYRSKNSPTCKNAVARTHGSWMLQVMGSCCKNKKDGGGIGDKIFFRLHGKFCKFSPRGPALTGSGKIDRENKKPHFRIFLGLKDCDGLEGYRYASIFLLLPFAFTASLA